MKNDYRMERRGPPDPFVRDLERALATKRMRRPVVVRRGVAAAAAMLLLAIGLIDRPQAFIYFQF